ncbi:MAG: DNA-binding protein WhiA [Lachnospiraceae bacterium]|nr:DNA-binding protein WhiA [Lachnospiraceae bacterium]
MSFSAEIKSELSNLIPTGRHCRLAEMAAILYSSGAVISHQNGKPEIIITTDNEVIKRKYFTLLKKAFNIEADTEKVLQALRINRGNEPTYDLSEGVSSLIIKNTCCRRAYLRGSFICNGSTSNPVSGYHLEFVQNFYQHAVKLQDILSGFSIEAKIIKRNKKFIVYIKEGALLVLLLNIMGAHNALLKLESLRVEKEVRNTVNRKVNFEAANISKSVTAAARQIEDIVYIKENMGFTALADNLRQIAELRLEYPEASLQELGELINPPIGKSGVNHRLRKLGEISRKMQGFRY